MHPATRQAERYSRLKKRKLQLESPAIAARNHADLLTVSEEGLRAAEASLAYVLKQLRARDCPKCGGPRFKRDGVLRSPDGRRFRIVEKSREFKLEEIFSAR